MQLLDNTIITADKFFYLLENERTANRITDEYATSVYTLFANKLVQQLNRLHENNIVHGDIHWNNIIVSLNVYDIHKLTDDSTFDVGFIDFGLCNEQPSLIDWIYLVMKSKTRSVNNPILNSIFGKELEKRAREIGIDVNASDILEVARLSRNIKK